jgi:uncharacterized protein
VLHDFWHNFTHNLFDPILLFFYLGFLIPILRVRLVFPPAVYQALTLYLLLAVGWRGGEELAAITATSVAALVGFVVLGFVSNLVFGVLTYLALSRTTYLRRIDRAVIAGYYGSDSAGTYATCVAVLAGLGIAVDAYMPVLLAVMQIPGCLIALYLAAHLRGHGMDPVGNMPDEPGYTPPAMVGVGPGTATQPAHRDTLEAEGAMRRWPYSHRERVSRAALAKEVFLDPGLCLLVGSIVIGFVSGIQGRTITQDNHTFFVSAFHGVLCLFLLEMGMTASHRLKDLRQAGVGFVAFGLLAPNVFATVGIVAAHGYAFYTDTEFKQGTYVLFAVLCAAASYIAVPAVQRLAIPEASPTLPLAASLGLTFPYNVIVGIPLYIEIAHLASWWGL